MADAENIRVYVRLRPLGDEDGQAGGAWRVDGNAVCQVDPGTGGQAAAFHLDAVFAGSTRNAAVYDQAAAGLVQQVLGGFNSTLFGYGQTASGKTHTMKGTSQEPGIIPLALEDLLQRAHANHDREFLIRVSYLEVYNERITDLLRPASAQPQAVHPSGKGLYEVAVSDANQALAELERGERRRHVSATKMNERSSRSHTLFRVVVESRAKEGGSQDGGVLVGMLNLVDLAGSESAGKTEASGQRQREGTSINKSLLALSKVVEKLSEGRKGAHIPYNDSTLTKVLRSSLGGNSRTAIICTCTPAAAQAAETKNTLRFATAAKKVQNRPELNETHSEAALLKRQEKEIAALKQRLAEAGNLHIEEEVQKLRAALLRQDQELAAKDAEVAVRQAELAAERAERARMQDAAEAELAAQLTEAQQRNAELESRVDQLEQQAEAAAQQAQQAEERAAQLEAALQEAQALLENKEAEWHRQLLAIDDDNQRAEQAAAEERQRLQAELSAAVEAQQSLRQQLADAQAERAIAEIEWQQQLSAAVEEQRQRLADAEAAHAAAAEQRQRELLAIDDANQRAGQAAAEERQRLQHELAAAAEEQQSLRQQLADAQAEHAVAEAAWQHQLNAAVEEQERLRQLLANLQAGAGGAEPEAAAEQAFPGAPVGQPDDVQPDHSLSPGLSDCDDNWGAGEPASPEDAPRVAELQRRLAAVEAERDAAAAQAMRLQLQLDRAGDAAALQQELEEQQAEGEAAREEVGRLQQELRQAQRAGEAAVAEATAELRRKLDKQSKEFRALRKAAKAADALIAGQKDKLIRLQAAAKRARKRGEEDDEDAAEPQERASKAPRLGGSESSRQQRSRDVLRPATQPAGSPQLTAAAAAAAAAAATATARCAQSSPVPRWRQQPAEQQQRRQGRAADGPPLEIPSDGELEMDLASRARSRR